MQDISFPISFLLNITLWYRYAYFTWHHNRYVTYSYQLPFLSNKIKFQKLKYKTRSKALGYKMYFTKYGIRKFFFLRYKLSKYKFQKSRKSRKFFHQTAFFYFLKYDVRLRHGKTWWYKTRHKAKTVLARQIRVKKSLTSPFISSQLLTTPKLKKNYFFFFINFIAKISTLTAPLKNSFWFTQFLKIYLAYYTQNLLNWTFFTPSFNQPFTNSFDFKKDLLILLKNPKVTYINRLMGGSIYPIIYSLIFTKSLNIFVNWVICFLKSIQIRRYRRFILTLNLFFKILVNFSLKYKLLTGFSFFFKGKLMGAGGTRKRKIKYMYGKFSSTKKTNRFNYKKFIIKTAGGIIGGQINIFFSTC